MKKILQSKNCHSCKYLEWIGVDSFFDSGYTCNKRIKTDTSQKKESYILWQLDDPEYLKKYKRCFEPEDIL